MEGSASGCFLSVFPGPAPWADALGGDRPPPLGSRAQHPPGRATPITGLRGLTKGKGRGRWPCHRSAARPKPGTSSLHRPLPRYGKKPAVLRTPGTTPPGGPGPRTSRRALPPAPLTCGNEGGAGRALAPRGAAAPGPGPPCAPPPSPPEKQTSCPQLRVRSLLGSPAHGRPRRAYEAPASTRPGGRPGVHGAQPQVPARIRRARGCCRCGGFGFPPAPWGQRRPARLGLPGRSERSVSRAPRTRVRPAFAPPPAGPQTRPRPQPVPDLPGPARTRPAHDPAPCRPGPAPSPPSRAPGPALTPSPVFTPAPRPSPRSHFALPATLGLKAPGPARPERPSPARQCARGLAPHPVQRLRSADAGGGRREAGRSPPGQPLQPSAVPLATPLVAPL